MEKFKSEITGHLDIFAAENADEPGNYEVLIHGDPNGLRSFARLLIKLADLNQETMKELPVGAREHVHLRPEIGLSNSSAEVIVGRLDAKGTGVFYEDTFQNKDSKTNE